MGVHLRTDRLVLREFEPDDVEILVALDADPLVMFHVTGGEATAREEIEQDILPAFLRFHRKDPDRGFWAVERGGDFIGWVHYWVNPEHTTTDPELGYRFKRTVWGHGYATEACSALLRHGFEVLGDERVYAETMAVHHRSRAVMERLGMRLVRTFKADWPVHIPGDEHGDVEYEITAEMWREQHPGSAAST